MMKIRVARVIYGGKYVNGVRLRAFEFAVSDDGILSGQFLSSLDDERCCKCDRPSVVMLNLDGCGYVCDRCLFDYLPEEVMKKPAVQTW